MLGVRVQKGSVRRANLGGTLKGKHEMNEFESNAVDFHVKVE